MRELLAAALQARPEPVPLPPMEHSIAAKYAARPAARFVRPSTRVRERRLGLRAVRLVHAAAARARPCCSGPEVAPLARLRGELARDPPGRSPAPAQRPAASAGRRCSWARSGRAGAVRRSGRRLGAVARLRTATATSAGGIVVRYRRRASPGSSSAAAGASATADLDPPQGHARTPARRREQTAIREVERGDRARGPDHRRRSTRSSTGSSSRGTRIHKTVHYFLMEPIGGDLAGHDHEFDEVRWIPFDRGRRRC